MNRNVIVAAGLAAVALSVLPRWSAASTPVPTPSQDAAAALQPRIVNGHLTSSYPATGALLLYDDTAATSLFGLCSGTLIGCHTFLTAAHCVCPDNADNAAACERQGKTDPATMRVFLQQGGLFSVASVAIAPDYTFAQRGDVAVLRLADAVTGIAPSAINMTRRPEIGTQGTIVGFGTTAGGRGSSNDSGIKREGAVTTAQCASDIPGDTHVCWQFAGTDANSCGGDSGGPLFIDFGSGPVVAGVTSGGMSLDCLPPDSAFDSDVFVNLSSIAAAAGTDLGTESCGLPAVGTASTTGFTSTGQLSRTSPDAQLQFDVPEGTAVLRVGLDGQFASSGPFSDVDDFDLFVRAGSAPTVDTFDCADTNPTPFGFCEVTAPHAGTWHVLVHLSQGTGTYQVTATTFAAAATPACIGDCNGDGTVTVDEVLTGVNIALGDAALTTCPRFSAGGAAAVTVAEVIEAVGYSLSQCPAS